MPQSKLARKGNTLANKLRLCLLAMQAEYPHLVSVRLWRLSEAVGLHPTVVYGVIAGLARRGEVKVVGRGRNADIAVGRIDTSGLPPTPAPAPAPTPAPKPAGVLAYEKRLHDLSRAAQFYCAMEVAGRYGEAPVSDAYDEFVGAVMVATISRIKVDAFAGIPAFQLRLAEYTPHPDGTVIMSYKVRSEDAPAVFSSKWWQDLNLYAVLKDGKWTWGVELAGFYPAEEPFRQHVFNSVPSVYRLRQFHAFV